MSNQNEKIKANINSIIKKDGLSRNGNLGESLKNKYKPPVSFSDKPDQAYADGVIAAKAVDMIDDLTKDSKSPFFLAVGFRKPHLPFSAPKQYWDLYKRERMPLAEFRERAKNTGRLSYHNSGEMRSFSAPDWDYKLDENRQLQLDDNLERELIHGYYACVTFIDFQIGKILKKLNAKPENSYFVGDTEYDVKTAHNAGMISLGVVWGMSNKDKLESFNPNHLFEDPKSMLDFFKENL